MLVQDGFDADQPRRSVRSAVAEVRGRKLPVKRYARAAGAGGVLVARHWADGGAGAEAVARAVVEVVERGNSNFKFVYDDAMPLWDKMKTIATQIYGASDITAETKVRTQIRQLQDAGYGHYPVCVA